MLSRNQINAKNRVCESLHGTIKIHGGATYDIENCGDCDCTLFKEKIDVTYDESGDDGSFHQNYDESGLMTEDTQLTNEVCNALL